MKKLLVAITTLSVLCSFAYQKNLKGVWEYCGGVYNGKRELPDKSFRMQREYDKEHYRASFIDSTANPVEYERGDYRIEGDSCLETQTYSMQRSQVLNKTMHYKWQINHDTLSLSGVLPNGTIVTEYWKKIK